MRSFPFACLAALSLLVVSCSEKSEPDNDGKPARPSVAEEKSESDSEKEAEKSEVAPEPQEIGEDCVAFLRATNAVPISAEKKDCPECPGGNAAFEVLKFNTFQDRQNLPLWVGLRSSRRNPC